MCDSIFEEIIRLDVAMKALQEKITNMQDGETGGLSPIEKSMINRGLDTLQHRMDKLYYECRS